MGSPDSAKFINGRPTETQINSALIRGTRASIPRSAENPALNIDTLVGRQQLLKLVIQDTGFQNFVHYRELDIAQKIAQDRISKTGEMVFESLAGFYYQRYRKNQEALVNRPTGVDVLDPHATNEFWGLMYNGQIDPTYGIFSLKDSQGGIYSPDGVTIDNTSTKDKSRLIEITEYTTEKNQVSYARRKVDTILNDILPNFQQLDPTGEFFGTDPAKGQRTVDLVFVIPASVNSFNPDSDTPSVLQRNTTDQDMQHIYTDIASFNSDVGNKIKLNLKFVTMPITRREFKNEVIPVLSQQIRANANEIANAFQ